MFCEVKGQGHILTFESRGKVCDKKTFSHGVCEILCQQTFFQMDGRPENNKKPLDVAAAGAEALKY